MQSGITAIPDRIGVAKWGGQVDAPRSLVPEGFCSAMLRIMVLEDFHPLGIFTRGWDAAQGVEIFDT